MTTKPEISRRENVETRLLDLEAQVSVLVEEGRDADEMKASLQEREASIERFSRSLEKKLVNWQHIAGRLAALEAGRDPKADR